MSREYLKGIKSENRLNRIRLIMKNDPVIGGQPNDNKNEFTSNTPLLDLACTLAHIHASGVGEYADLRKVQNQPPKFFFGKGFMSGISSLKGNGILVAFGQWRDNTGRYAVKQFFYSNNEISYRNALSETTWSNWISILTEQSVLDYHKLKNVPLTSTLSDDKGKISTIYAVNEVNRKAVTAQKSANNADAKAVKAQKTADSVYNLVNIKQDQLQFIGTGNVLKETAYGMKLGESNIRFSIMENGIGIYSQEEGRDTGLLMFDCSVEGQAPRAWLVQFDKNGLHLKRRWQILIEGANTSTDKSGFLRGSGNANALVESDVTNSLGNSQSLVTSQALVTSIANKISEVPVDQIFYFESIIPPKGYIARNGQAIDKHTMPKLYARYGANMPDDRNRYHRMQGSLTGSIGSTQEDAIQTHKHQFNYPNGSATGGGGGNVPRGNGSNSWAVGGVIDARTASETRVKGRIVLACNKIQ